jgi:hypothetical protein
VGPFLTDIEVARLLEMPVRGVDKLDLHRCDDGYHIDAVTNFCATHGLPTFDRPTIVGLRGLDSPAADDVRWHDLLEEALLNTDRYTRVLVYAEASLTRSTCRRLFIARPDHLRLIAVGRRWPHLCHASAASWDEALTYSREFL